jgi:hypothetical protein
MLYMRDGPKQDPKRKTFEPPKLTRFGQLERITMNTGGDGGGGDGGTGPLNVSGGVEGDSQTGGTPKDFLS